MRKYCVIKENQAMRTLLSIIKSHYQTQTKDSLIQEVNLEDVLNRIDNKDIRMLVKNAWQDLETILGYEIGLLENHYKKSVINMLNRNSIDMSFVVKVRADETSQSVLDSIYRSSSIKVELKDINI